MGLQSARPRVRPSVYDTRKRVPGCELDAAGCEYGRITRERLINATVLVQSVDRKVNYVLAAVGLQLFGFLLSVVGLLVYKVKV
jgi:hypothetical protein